LIAAEFIDRKSGELTALGFQFVLMEAPSQVH